MFIEKSDLRPFLEKLSKSMEVYIPSGPRFERLSKGVDMNLSRKTFFSAKKLFFPQREVLFEFDAKGKTIKEGIKAPGIVLFGARPCDLNAVKYMDMVFRDDPYYIKRRENTVLIGLQCGKPKLFENCYCHYTGTFFADNYDILLIESDSGFAAKPGSEKGIGLLESRFFSEKGKNPDSLLEELKKEYVALTGGKMKSMEDIRDSEVKKLAKDCFSCTACTTVCPTCHSFVIEDELNTDLKSGRRVRLWDSCQLQRYTRVAGNNVFRPSRLQRVRQRINCKFRYSLEQQNMMSCTGCGRCIDVCNKEIDIFKVFG